MHRESGRAGCCIPALSIQDNVDFWFSRSQRDQGVEIGPTGVDGNVVGVGVGGVPNVGRS